MRGTAAMAEGSSMMSTHRCRNTAELCRIRIAPGEGARKSNCIPTPYLWVGGVG